MTDSIGFFGTGSGGGGGGGPASYRDENGAVVYVDADHPLPVGIAGGVTVELPDDVEFNIDGSVISLTAGTEVALIDGTVVGLAPGSAVRIDASQVPLPVTGTVALSGTPTVTLSGSSTVALSAGTTVGLASGAQVALAAGTSVALAAGTSVALSAGASVKVTADSPLPVLVSGPVTVSGSVSVSGPITGTVALAAGTAVAVDDSIPIDVNIVSGGGGGTVALAPGTSVALAPGTSVALAAGSTVGLSGPVALAAGSSVALAAGTSVAVTGTVNVGTVDVDDSTPIRVDIITGGITGSVEVTNPTGEALDVTGTVALAAGTSVALAAGTSVALAAGSTVALAAGTTVAIDDSTPIDVNVVSGGGSGTTTVSGSVEVTNPTGQTLDVTLDGPITGTVALAGGSTVALASGSTVGLAPGSSVALASGATVAIDDSTPINVAIVSGGGGGGPASGTVEVINPTGQTLDVTVDGPITGQVSLAAGTTVGIDDSTPIDVNIVSGGGSGTTTVTGSVTIANTTASRVPVGLDEPIDVNIVSGGSGGAGASGDIVTTPDGDAQLVSLADGATVALAADTEVALADGSTVALSAGTSVALAAGCLVEVTNKTGETLDVTVDGDVHLAAGTSIALASGTSVKVTADTPLPVAVNGTVALAGSTTVHLAADATVALAAGTTVGLSVGGTALSAGNPVPVAVQGTVPVSGTVAITGTPAVTVSGTPNVTVANPSLAVTGTVGISGTPNVAVTNTPAVTVSGTPNVAVTNTPTVAVQGTVPVSGTVAISGTPAVTVSGTPAVTVASGPGAKVTTGDGDAQLVVVQNYASFPTGSGGGGTVDTELPAAAALSDTAANPTTPQVGADAMTYNGATWERSRTATAANATAGTGVAAAGTLGWDATNSVYRRLLTDTAGNLRTTAAAGLALIASATVATSGDVIASTDVSAYNAITIRASGTGAQQCMVATSNDGTTWSTMPVSITTNYGVGPVNYAGIGGIGGWFSWPSGVGFISFPVTARYVRLQQQAATSITVSMYGSAGAALVQPVSLPTQRATFSWAAATGAQALTDVSGLNFVTVHVTAYTSGSPTFQASNDGTNFVAVNLAPLGGGATASTVGATGIWAGPVPARYFRFSAGASSTLSGVVEFTSAPIVPFGTNVALAGGSATATDTLASSTVAGVNTFGMLFNGSTWERSRTLGNVNGTSAGTGLAAAGLVGYDATGAVYRRVLVDTAGNLAISLSAAPPGSATGGTGKTVPTATSTVLGASQVCKSVTLKAGRFNTGVIYVGWGSASASTGMELYGGETISVDAANVNALYLLATNTTDYVTYMWVG